MDGILAAMITLIWILIMCTQVLCIYMGLEGFFGLDKNERWIGALVTAAAGGGLIAVAYGIFGIFK